MCCCQSDMSSCGVQRSVAYGVRIELQGEVGEQTRRVGELGDKIAKMRRECDYRAENVHLERDGLQVGRDSTASQPSGVQNSLTAARGRLKEPFGHLAPNHFAA